MLREFKDICKICKKSFPQSCHIMWRKNRCLLRKARLYRAFLLPKRRFFSVQKHRCKIAVFPLWQDSNSRKLNTKYEGRQKRKIYLPFLLPSNKAKTDMLQKELDKRLRACYDTKIDSNGWPEVSSDGIPLCRIKYNGQFLSNADKSLSDEYRSKAD